MTDTIKVMMVDDEPLIRKAVKMELNSRGEEVPCRMNDDGEVTTRRIEVVETFANGLQLLSALRDSTKPKPDYILVDMEFQGEPTGGIRIADKVSREFRTEAGCPIGIIILSGRFDNPCDDDKVRRRERVLEIGRVVFDALNHGARAFVSKNAAGGFSIENIVHAISSLERGERYYFNYPVMLTLKEAAEYYIMRQPGGRADFEISATEHELLLLEAAGCTAQEIALKISSPNETDKSIQEKQKELSRKLDIPNKSGARIAKAIQYNLIDPNEIQFLKR
ncbi:MAG: response regulator transcription factor [Bacteroidales bacterium]|nr:response regulator transcription factor [Bacteroidales bacterium]